MKAQGIDPKVVADQQGHTVDVNQSSHSAMGILICGRNSYSQIRQAKKYGDSMT